MGDRLDKVKVIYPEGFHKAVTLQEEEESHLRGITTDFSSER